ncbi:hypothetical protein SDC9_23969 [bioreactor metagenome]|uniref:Glycosyltransferase 2-like domain-containing protein n=1 Tax=bioreactor metagenome TaxID=1076179 RepID=A0A644UGJ0_9ZZZZ|nr:glycosyltransferase family A protein [Methanobrevibacter sp.]MEA4957725.1 glycosyltransferase family A protein [Methanobrevibacter sp.]
MPIFNAEKHLKSSLDSIINQSIGLENLQVILINDGSTDDSKNILNEYARKYDNFLVIHIEKNIGGAYGPRNIGIKYASADYLMFLDSDDRYELNACEILYGKISSKDYKDLDIVFGRYKRIYKDESHNGYLDKKNEENYGENNEINYSKGLNMEYIQKSYSPYEDNIFEYSDDVLENYYLSPPASFFWKNIFSNLFYGKKIKKYDSNKEYIKEIYIRDINNNVDILKILPSIWTKIYSKDLIINNDIKFPSYISGEDLNFVIESYLNAKGILFLNESFITNYYMRDSQENKSITKDISFKLVLDSLKSYKACLDLCNSYKFQFADVILNPFLLNWIQLFLKFNGDNKEKKELLNLAKQMKKSNNGGLMFKLLISFTIFIIRIF